MKIELIQVGKTNESYLQKGIEEYSARLKKYISFVLKTLPELKNTSAMNIEQQKHIEGRMILEYLESGDFVVVLDERGTELSSIEFSDFIQKRMLASIKKLVFIIGGPYGFSDECYNRANYKIALSKMTFSHQLVRLIFYEQLYRAFTILRNEPYHH